jgi:hypothetical protein
MRRDGLGGRSWPKVPLRHDLESQKRLQIKSAKRRDRPTWESAFQAIQPSQAFRATD